MAKIALLSRDTAQDLAHSRFHDVAGALAARGLEPWLCAYDDQAPGALMSNLAACAAVLVWANPMQDGRDRRDLDDLLREVERRGVLVSGRPDVLDRLGVKAVVAATAALGWSGDAAFYADAAALRAGLPARLDAGPRVIKPNRGNGGDGIWKVQVAGPGRITALTAARGAAPVLMDLETFLTARGAEAARVGGLLDQAFQPRLGDGMIRCYLAADRVVGFGWQKVRALLDGGAPQPRTYSGPEDPRFQALRARMEQDWTPGLMRILGLGPADLPAIWDADFLFGPPTPAGDDTFVLCEINANSTHPYPDTAPAAIAACVASRLAGRAPTPSQADRQGDFR